MEELPGIGWLWRGLRGRSVTFAALFAFSVLGFSAVAHLRHVLSWVHAPWLAWLLLPAFLIGVLAKKELEWMPDETQRLTWARLLIFGSLIGAVLYGMLMPQPERPPDEPPPARVERHGPPSR